MIVSDIWDARLENWAAVYRTAKRQGTSIAFACIQAAPEKDPSRYEEPQDGLRRRLLDQADADLVERLLCSGAISQFERDLIVGVWVRRRGLRGIASDIGYPVSLVKEKIRVACVRLEGAEHRMNRLRR